MIGSMSPDGNIGPSRAAELSALLDEAISHTRTISYLFHPPLLDEIGFASAAKWLIEGFSQRTGLQIAVNIRSRRPACPGGWSSLSIERFRKL